MPKLRISIVEYLNTAPLVWGFTHGPFRGRYELSFTVPSQCAESLRAGESDVAIIPAIEYHYLDDVVALPEMAIAAKREVRSLLVISRKPIEQARRIALDTGSRSTQALVKILCAEHWKISAEFLQRAPGPAMLANSDAALLIGDPALRFAIALEQSGGAWRADRSHEVSVQPPADWGRDRLYVYDVASEWKKLTGLPCVLALWVGHKLAIRPEVVADFLASKDYGISRIGEIAADASGSLKLPAAALGRYLRENIDFSLDEENLRGLDLYFQKCASLNLIPRTRPLEFAPVAASVRTGD